MRLDEIIENYLYHATTAPNAQKIVQRDTFLSGKTTQHINGKTYKGVSTTRDLSFAKYYQTPALGVILRFNKDRLRQNKKIIPYSWFGKRQYKDELGGRKDEAEEFIPGGIQNLDQTLDAILVAKNWQTRFEEWVDSLKNNGELGDIDKKYVNLYSQAWRKLIKHPKITYISW